VGVLAAAGTEAQAHHRGGSSCRQSAPEQRGLVGSPGGADLMRCTAQLRTRCCLYILQRHL
jgi:hypothetical protein